MISLHRDYFLRSSFPWLRLLVWTAAIFVLPLAAQTITPPNASGMTLPYPYLYLNSPGHWAYMAPQNTNGTTSGFLPSVPLTRVVGGQGVHWGNIMTGPPSGTYPNNQAVYSAGLAGMGMGMDPGSKSACQSANSSTFGYWWPAAVCNQPSGYNATPNNILYTFYTVPAWASVINGTYGSPLTGWTVSNASATCAPSSSCVVTINTTGNPGIVSGARLMYVIGGSSYTITISSVDNPTSTSPALHFSSGSNGGVTGTASNSHFTFTNSEPPSDASNATETCNLPDGNAATGHCFFKEYVTWMMMQSCKNTSGVFGVSVPYAASDANALSTCVIHYWEGWNEFTGDGYWTGSYTQLAQMMNDAAYIIHQYCNNCYFIAGSVSAGGQAGHSKSTVPVSDGSTIYIQALGELLSDWYHLNVSTHPDIVSIHPYPGHDNIYLPAMPEVSGPAQWDPSVTPYSTKLAANSCETTGNAIGCINICSAGYNATGGSCSATVANPTATGTWAAGGALNGCNEQNTNGPATFPNFGFAPYTLHTNYTSDPANLACIDSFVNTFRATRQMLTNIDSIEGIPTTFVSSSTPIWNTESGYGQLSEVDFRGATAQSLTDPNDSSLTTFYMQSYVARMGILAAESSSALNLWYQWDINGNGVCTDSSAPCLAIPTDFRDPYQNMLGGSNSNWGQLGNDFTAGSTVFDGSFRPVRAAFTYNRVFHWLQGKAFGGGPSISTVQRNTNYVYGDTVFDGTNVITVKIAGTSGTSAPSSWNNAVYGITTDGTVTWQNMGDKNCRDLSTFSSSGTPAKNVWACYLTASGYSGTIAWYAPLDQSITFNMPSGQSCLKDIDGKVIGETAGSAHTIYNRPVLLDNTSSASCPTSGTTDGLPEADYTPQ